MASRPLTAARLPFAIFVGAILATGLVVLLLLHTMAAQDAFRLQALQHESAQLADSEQQLALAEQQREAPAALAARARSLGMVPTGSIAFVELRRHGKIVGVVKAAPPPPPPPAPSASPSPAPQASAKHQVAHAPAKRPAGPSTRPTARRVSRAKRH